MLRYDTCNVMTPNTQSRPVLCRRRQVPRLTGAAARGHWSADEARCHGGPARRAKQQQVQRRAEGRHAGRLLPRRHGHLRPAQRRPRKGHGRGVHAALRLARQVFDAQLRAQDRPLHRVPARGLGRRRVRQGGGGGGGGRRRDRHTRLLQGRRDSAGRARSAPDRALWRLWRRRAPQGPTPSRQRHADAAPGENGGAVAG